MDIATARTNIEGALKRMDALYGQPVFNEWAILAMKGAKSAAVVAYSGPRVENFKETVRIDAGPLCALGALPSVHEGDFQFALEAAGTHLDAFMKLGPVSFLVCNHTEKTMADIRADARWLKAQAEFFNLGERFREDPLQ